MLLILSLLALICNGPHLRLTNFINYGTLFKYAAKSSICGWTHCNSSIHVTEMLTSMILKKWRLPCHKYLKELLSRAKLRNMIEMSIDRLVCQQSSKMDTSNEDSKENTVGETSENPNAHPMSFLTRTSSSTGLSSREAALKGNI